MINKFENLNVWKYSKELAIFVYSLTDKYPKCEIFSITSQTTRAAVSIPANIAEGSSRSSNKDFRHFLEIALGSAFELKTLIEIAYSRKYINDKQKELVDCKLESVVKMTFALKRSIK